MFELKYNAPKEIHYLIDWSCNDNNRLITKNLYETIINFYNGERINFLCSWFCGLEYEYFDKMGFDCHYYDVDEYVCKANRGLTDKIYNVDVIFDEVKIEEGLYVNKFCEDTYPIGKIYKGEICSLPMYDEKNEIVRGLIENIPTKPEPWPGVQTK